MVPGGTWRVYLTLAWLCFAGVVEDVTCSRICDFYVSHAYPATYNLELNVTCGSFVPAANARNPALENGLALQAAREHPAGDVIVWVPESAHLWEPTIPHTIRHEVSYTCQPRVYAEAVLATALLVEKRDPDSRFKHYIAALAQLTLPELSNIAVFGKDHLRVLNVTRPDLVESFTLALDCIGAAQNSLPALQRQPASKSEQLWAYGVVKSRSVSIEGRLALVPVLDLVNHERVPNVALTKLVGSGAALRSLSPLRKGEDVVLSYGDTESNLGLLATYGFVTPNNPSGALLPFDFNRVFEIRPRHGDVVSTNASSREIGFCEDALRSPQLWRDAPLLLEPRPSKCLEDKLFRYYEHHYTEIDVLSAEHVHIKALELIGQLCDQILQKYRTVSNSINRLQQHGQKVKDWMTLQVAHEAVEDMRLLETCVLAAKAKEESARAKERDDL